MVTKLGNMDQANLLVPQEDLVKFEQQPKFNVEQM